MLLPICLGIFLVGMLFVPSAFAVFPDPEKDPRHYLMRYYTEIAYQEWFDKNFPNDTIEDKVGYPKKIVTDDYYVNSLFDFAIKIPINLSDDGYVDKYGIEEAQVSSGGETSSIVAFEHPRGCSLDDQACYGSGFNMYYFQESDAPVDQILSQPGSASENLLDYFSNLTEDEDQQSLKINDESVKELTDGVYQIRYDFSSIQLIPEYTNPVSNVVSPTISIGVKQSIVVFLYPNGEWYGLNFIATADHYDTDIIEFNNSIDTFYVGKTEKLSDMLQDYAPDSAAAAKAAAAKAVAAEAAAAAETAAAKAAATEPVPEQTAKEILPFFDPSKGIKHYVERYTMEPDYKAWFERNYPDYTIYEGVGITQSQYQKIVNDLTVPLLPVAEQKVVVQISSGGNEIIYVLIAVVAVGGGIGAIFIIKKGSNAPKPVQQESPSRRQKTVLFCGNCGNSLKPMAKFCGMCGNPHS